MGYSGMKLPIVPGPDGRSAIIEGVERVKQLVAVALSEGHNINPFNEIGFRAPIFKSPNDVKARIEILAKISSIFKKLEKEGIAKLKQQPQFFFDEQTMKWFVRITPLSLEDLDSDGRPQEFSFVVEVGAQTP